VSQVAAVINSWKDLYSYKQEYAGGIVLWREGIASMEEEVRRLAAESTRCKRSSRHRVRWKSGPWRSETRTTMSRNFSTDANCSGGEKRLCYGSERKMKQAVQKAVEMGVVNVVELRCAGNAAPNETINDLRRTMLCWTVLSKTWTLLIRRDTWSKIEN
jgi:hypothetical protein